MPNTINEELKHKIAERMFLDLGIDMARKETQYPFLPYKDRDYFLNYVMDLIQHTVDKAVLHELELIEQMDNTIIVPFRLNILDEVEDYEDLLYKEHFVYIDDRIKELKSLSGKE